MTMLRLSLLIVLFNFFITAKAAGIDIWEAVRREFTLQHETNRSEVQEQIKWLVAHPGFIHNACRQSQPYIYHILKEIKHRGLPGELALLPMIESAYNPFAYSRKGAAGLWQLMPSTGTDLGLRQDWWFDGRRGISSSTKAALAYLLYLNKFFNGNWLLTIAAYDAGIGTLKEATRQSLHFWQLLLPRETLTYVPRFLALAALIRDPAHYNIVLPKIPCQPYFEEVNIDSQIDLAKAAKLAGISYRELIKLNPGYNRWATAPYKPFSLSIPKENVWRFNLNLANIPRESRVSFTRHRVIEGDNLDNIANRYHTTVNLLVQLNQLKSNYLVPTQTILIPKSSSSPITMMAQTKSPLKPNFIELTQPRVIHIVQAAENYQKIEKMYKVSSKEIQLWNKLAAAKPLYPGQQLIIFKNKARSTTG